MASSIGFSVSDGDPSHRPNTTGYERAPRENEIDYRAKVGKIIAPKLDGYRPGMSHILKSLPEGYELWQKHRKDTPSAKAHIDRYVYGHPTHYLFRSTNEFAPHALWLATARKGRCACIGCTGKRSKSAFIKPSGTSTPKSTTTDVEVKGRALREKYSATAPVKETIFTKLLTDLKKEGEMDMFIQDPDNLSFKIEQKNFVPEISRLVEEGAFIPRASEIVLFHSPPENMSDLSNVEWKAGLVTETPYYETLPLSISEIITPNPDKKGLGINYSGFRVEPMSDPNSGRKDEQLQYQYLPLSCLRPFNLYSAYLASIPESQWHKSVHNALKCASSFCLVLPLKFVGRWPNAWILHGGIYLGPELLVNGDAVTLLPRCGRQEEQPSVLVITAVALSFKGLQPDPPSYTHVTGATSSVLDVRLHGRLFTPSSKSEEDGAMDTSTTSLPPPMRDPHLPYIPLSSPSVIHCVPLSRVQGRLYEPDALAAYNVQGGRVSPDQKGALTQGRGPLGQGLGLPLPQSTASTTPSPTAPPPSSPSQILTTSVIRARAYACAHDTRIVELRERLKGQGKVDWFWGNDRIEALGLNTFGELDVGEVWEDFMGRERMAYDG